MAHECVFGAAVFMSTTQASPWAVSHALAFTAGNDHVRVSRLGPAPELSVLTAN